MALGNTHGDGPSDRMSSTNRSAEVAMPAGKFLHNTLRSSRPAIQLARLDAALGGVGAAILGRRPDIAGDSRVLPRGVKTKHRNRRIDSVAGNPSLALGRQGRYGALAQASVRRPASALAASSSSQHRRRCLQHEAARGSASIRDAWQSGGTGALPGLQSTRKPKRPDRRTRPSVSMPMQRTPGQ